MSDDESMIVEWDEVVGLSKDSVEVGGSALWTVSSCKPGSGVQNLRDNDRSTVWQSDGAQPHTISVYFQKRTFVESICFYVDFDEDETYTPSRVCVRVGSTPSETVPAAVKDLEQPKGWVVIPLTVGSQQWHVFIVELCILANHQNGRDTHVRQCKIFGKDETPAAAAVARGERAETGMSRPLKWHATLR